MPSTAKASERTPTAELKDILPQEVSFVDLAANLKRYIRVTKDADGNGKAEDDGVLTLPSAAKVALMEGLEQVLEQVSATAQIIGAAEVDDSAEVPEELTAILARAAMMLQGLADQYAPASAEPDPAESEPEDMDGEDDAAKAAAAKAAKGDPAEAVEAAADVLLAAITDMGGSVEKAGKRISGARLKRLQKMLEDFQGLIKELANDDTDPEAKSVAKAATPDQLAALAKRVDDVVAALAATDERVLTVTKGVEKLDAEQTRVDIAKARTDIAALGAMLQTPVPSQVGAPPVAEPEAPPAGDHVWSSDISQSIRDRK